MKYFYGFYNMQVFKELFFEGEIVIGDQLFYDFTNPAVGSSRYSRLTFILQPNLKINLRFDWIHDGIKSKTDDTSFYSVDILNLKTTYQFNKYFFVRGEFRYDSFQSKIVTDFLASFTLIPGTVVHLGYGSLYERQEWRDNRWIPGQGNYVNLKNSLFFKVSYLWKLK